MVMKENLQEVKNPSFEVIPSDHYETFMREEALPYIEKRKKTALFDRDHGFKLYCEYYQQEGARGSIFISHGFSESTKKYHEVIYYMMKEGYSVCIIDHRGHGRSRREDEVNISQTPSYIENFQDYVNEIDYAVQHVMKEFLPAPYFLYCHSMGGAIGALYVEQHPDVFKKVVFSSPMFEINRGGIPYPIAKFVVSTACLFGKKKGYMMGQGKYSPEENFEGSASSCYERYLYYYKLQQEDPKIQSSGPSYNWTRESFLAGEKLLKAENIEKISCPVLLFQAEKDDFVYPGGQDQFMDKVRNGKMVFVPGSKHEIYLSDDETMKKYFHVIFDFLSPL